MSAPQFYPALNKLVSSENVPEPIKSGIDSVFSKLFYKSYYVEKSVYGDTAYHHLVLVFNKVGFNLFGGDDGMEIIFNPGSAADTTEIPISLYYNLPIIKYVRKITLQELSTVKDYFNLVLEMFNISISDILFEAMTAFFGDSENPFQDFIDEFNNDPDNASLMPLVLPEPSEDSDDDFTIVESLLQQLEDNSVNVKIYLLQHFIEGDGLQQGIDNLSSLFKRWMGEFSFETILDLFIPKFSVSVDVLKIALAFPRKWLTPIDPDTLEVIPDESVKAMLTYNVGSVKYDSETGFEFVNPDNFDLSACQIGNTGIIIEIENFAFDFSNDKNIPQADADGRPLSFKGIYAEKANIILPKKWFKKENGATLKISGKQLLVGTEGGISGTVAIETIIPGGTIGNDEYMWFKFGGDNGFRLGFQEFDISFKQNKVTTSNIKGALEIKKFVYPEGALDKNGDEIYYPTVVHIDIEGHLHDNGDFNLTASAEPPYPIEFPGVFTYHLKSVEFGKEDDKIFIGTAGSIEFMGFLKDTLHLDKIDIDRLRIYSDGTIELEGGSIQLTSPIVLKLGPVEITVSAIHYGSHQREYDGVMRKFNFFGFDGGISVDPLGIEIRGDGVKYYYCVDDVAGHDKPDSYLHVETIYLDLTIPSSTPVAIINGWLSIPEPGVSKEYAGGLKLQLPKVKIAGSVDMKLMPKYPAFIVDASLDFPVPIPLGPIGIYGFRGLFGYRYVAEKEAIGLVSGVDTWYDYYKAPPRGIHVQKFNGPDKTVHSGTPISIGAGASLGTSADNGTILNIKAMVLISIPSLFMIDGRATVLSARLGLDDPGEPPFFAFVAVGDNSLEFGFGADFKMPTKPSSFSIIKLYAEIQAGFFFKNQHPWYVNVGTKTNPITATIVEILTIKSYVMLSAKGIEGGARGEFNFDKNYAGIKVYAHAYIEVGGKISFEKPQFSAYLAAGVAAGIDLWGIISFDIAIDVTFGVEAPKPFLIYGTLHYSITIHLWIVSITYHGDIELSWDFNSEVDRARINPMINPDNAAQIESLVMGVSMLSNERFDLAYLGDGPATTPVDARILQKIIPLDTYIDIKTEKGFLPAAIGNLIGGINNPPARYTDLVPPDESVKGHPIRRVTHEYSMVSMEILSYNPTSHSWANYNPYKAMYPTDPNPVLNTLKAGQFQKEDGQYNTVRVMATTPFSYTEQGQPGWYVPEQYGINQATLTCEAQQIDHRCANFLAKVLGQKYYCYNQNEMFFSNDVAFLLYDRLEEDFAYITNLNNTFLKAKSLAFNNRNKLRLILPQGSVQVGLKLTCTAQSVKIKYYAPLIDDTVILVPFGNPDPGAANPNAPYEVIVNSSSLNAAIEYNHPDWKPVTKIEIEPMFADVLSQQIASLEEQIETINNNNVLITLGLLDGEIQSTAELEDELHHLECGGGTVGGDSFINRYSKKDALNYFYSKEFTEYDDNFIYAIGKTGDRGLITKLNPAGDIVWEKTYGIPEDKDPLVFKRIIQVNNTEAAIPAEYYFRQVIYATTDTNQYVFAFSEQDGEIIWIKKVNWKDVDILVHIEASKMDYSFYLTISDRNEIDTDKYPCIAKIDGDGNLVKANSLIIPKEEFIINALDNNTNSIVAAGRYIDQDSRGVIIRMDHTLKIGDALLIGDPYTTIHDIKLIDNKKMLVSGYDNKYNGLFVSVISGTGNASAYNFTDTINHGSVLQLAENGFYMLQTTDVDGILLKMDWDFNVIWKKEIHLQNGTNGVRNFTYNEDTQRITLNAYNQSDKSLVVYTNKDLQSCLTNTLTGIQPSRTTYKIDHLTPDSKQLALELSDVKAEKQSIESDKTELCTSGGGCGEKDDVLCALYEQILYIYNNCLIDPGQVGDVNLRNIVPCAQNILSLLSSFNEENPNYGLVALFAQQIKDISDFIGKPDLTHYIPAWEAVGFILDYLSETGNCNCSCGETDCVENKDVCEAYTHILKVYENLLAYQQTLPNEVYASGLKNIISTLESLPPSILEIPALHAYYISLVNAVEIHGDEFTELDSDVLDGLLDWLMAYGNCNCSDKGKDITMLHEVCWMSQLDYTYNINIPSQAAISLDAQAAIDGINTYIQPIWRPDTSYLIRFTLRDKVDGNATLQPFVFNYGFTTAGPVGYFHKHDYATYGDITLKGGKILEDANGTVRDANGNSITVTEANFDTVFNTDDPNNPPQFPIVAHPEKYPLTSLRQYIDYNRSYPNADGNLLSAKPLFYDDDQTTKITLFFNKAYTTNFFKKWELYNGVGPFDGMLKIVIKDPREDITITNPPYLDTVDTTIDVAQTTQEWHVDENPQIPFVLSQYANLFGNGGCTGIITTIKPKSEYIIVTPKKLKPSKLYTAIVNNMYDVNHSGHLDNIVAETTEVHKFGFQTSQYRNFKEQVTSYKINKNVEGEAAQVQAIFTIAKELDVEEVNAAYETIKGINPIVAGTFLTQPTVDNLNNNYQHRYDRVFEGIFGLSPIDKPISTEFNFIRNQVTNQVVAVIVKNPEPFNNPKIPYDFVKDCLVVLNGTAEDTTYKVLLSKDYSQAIIMNDSKVIPFTSLKIQFKYKIWDGNNYVVPAEPDPAHPVYKIVVEIPVIN